MQNNILHKECKNIQYMHLRWLTTLKIGFMKLCRKIYDYCSKCYSWQNNKYVSMFLGAFLAICFGFLAGTFSSPLYFWPGLIIGFRYLSYILLQPYYIQVDQMKSAHINADLSKQSVSGVDQLHSKQSNLTHTSDHASKLVSIGFGSILYHFNKYFNRTRHWYLLSFLFGFGYWLCMLYWIYVPVSIAGLDNYWPLLFGVILLPAGLALPLLFSDFFATVLTKKLLTNSLFTNLLVHFQHADPTPNANQISNANHTSSTQTNSNAHNNAKLSGQIAKYTFIKFCLMVAFWAMFEYLRMLFYPFYPISFIFLSSIMTSQIFAYIDVYTLSVIVFAVLISPSSFYIKNFHVKNFYLYCVGVCVLSTLFTSCLKFETHLSKIKFALIQPNIEQRVKNSYLGAKQAEYVIHGLSYNLIADDVSTADNKLDTKLDTKMDAKVDILVWPEAAMPSILDYEYWDIYEQVCAALEKEEITEDSVYLFNVHDQTRLLTNGRLILGLDYDFIVKLGKSLIAGVITVDLSKDQAKAKLQKDGKKHVGQPNNQNEGTQPVINLSQKRFYNSVAHIHAPSKLQLKYANRATYQNTNNNHTEPESVHNNVQHTMKKHNNYTKNLLNEADESMYNDKTNEQDKSNGQYKDKSNDPTAVQLASAPQLQYLYDKQVLIPFGEYVPLRQYMFSFLQALAAKHEDYSEGNFLLPDQITYYYQSPAIASAPAKNTHSHVAANLSINNSSINKTHSHTKPINAKALNRDAFNEGDTHATGKYEQVIDENIIHENSENQTQTPSQVSNIHKISYKIAYLVCYESIFHHILPSNKTLSKANNDTDKNDKDHHSKAKDNETQDNNTKDKQDADNETQDKSDPDKLDCIMHISNDAWFGLSACLDMHFDHMKVHAIAHGCCVLRCVNTGITALIDKYGRVLAKLKKGELGVLIVPIVT